MKTAVTVSRPAPSPATIKGPRLIRVQPITQREVRELVQKHLRNKSFVIAM